MLVTDKAESMSEVLGVVGVREVNSLTRQKPKAKVKAAQYISLSCEARVDRASCRLMVLRCSGIIG